MKNCVSLGAAYVLCTAAGALARPGPDVIVGDLSGPTRWGTLTVGPNTITGYSIGTTACNRGDFHLQWLDGSNRHPVIGQNIHRLMNGRIEQIGQSWLKHSFCALQGTVCSSCSPEPGCGCCSWLGVGCSDPYTSDRNGSQSMLGPRSEVNAFTGAYPWPHGNGSGSGVLWKRCQVNNNDLNPAMNPGALYFGEAEYVTLDDATAGNGANNASHRRLLVGGLVSGGYSLSFTGTTNRMQGAINAWKNHGNGLNTPDPDVNITEVGVTADGRFLVGVKASDLGGGQWHYEYAVENINSHRSGGSFSVPIPAGVIVTNVGFHDVDYHSGEPYDNTDWPSTIGGSAVEWHSPQTFAQNPNSNALRWGTLYNFRFDANVAPVAGDLTLGLFRPSAGNPDTIAIAGKVPGTPPPPVCPCDYNHSSSLDSQDFFDFLSGFFAGNPDADFNNSGAVDSQDFFDWLTCFFTPPVGC